MAQSESREDAPFLRWNIPCYMYVYVDMPRGLGSATMIKDEAYCFVFSWTIRLCFEQARRVRFSRNKSNLSFKMQLYVF